MKYLCLIMLILGISNATAQSWQHNFVDEGIKPALALDSQGNPHISFMLERFNGFVRHARWNSGGGFFVIFHVADGYFYGPLDLAMDDNDMPHINYHDHTTEDQVHLYLDGPSWVNEQIGHPGHDGWDNSIVIDANGRPHTSTIDPSGFGGQGIEYARFGGTSWQIETIGSGPLMYANSTSLALDSQGNPHIAYYNDTTRRLMYATKDSGNWVISTVDEQGDVGRFASLLLNELDEPRIAYYHHIGDSLGTVRFTAWENGDWSKETVDTLSQVSLGFSGARHTVSLQFDSQGRPVVSYSDQKWMKLAVRRSNLWDIETVLDVRADSTVLGQMTSLSIDDQDNPHIAYFVVTTPAEMDGAVYLASRDMPLGIAAHDAIPSTISLLDNYPNPFNPSTTIRYRLSTAQTIRLTLFDVSGRYVTTLEDGRRHAGEHEVRFDAAGLSSGIFFYRLESEVEALSGKMLLIK